jgi:hypothetical protein
MRKFSDETVDKFLSDLFIERISDYLGANVPMNCRCKKCGQVFSPRFSNLKASRRGHNCVKWNSITSANARQELLIRGFEMIGPFEGTKKKTKSKCLTCGQISFPTISNLRSNPNQSCIFCKGLVVNANEAMKYIENAGFQLIGKWVGASKPIKAICKKCGKNIEIRYSVIKQGHGCAKCAGKLVDQDSAIKLMKIAGYEPIVPYPGSGKKWKCIHTLCGKEVSPVYGNIVSGRGGCSSCAKWGFDNSKPSYVYLIFHPQFNAFKVGIANIPKLKKFDRVHRFENSGWKLLKIYYYQEGEIARKVEKMIFKVIRKELEIPMYLNKELMRKYQGETETFSADFISEKKVIEIIENSNKKVN